MKKEKERRKVWKEIRIESEKTKERKARRRGGNKEEERERELNQSLIQEELGKEETRGEVGTKALKKKGEERKRILWRYQRPEKTCVYQSNSKQDGLTWLGKFGNQVKKA